MGSPLSPVIADFFMEDFEKKAIEQAPHKPVCWYRYVDDIFVIWPHGQEKLTEFLNHLNGLHNNIQFTMEIVEDHLPFLDIDIYRKTDGFLGHKAYRKPTHTNLYLHQNSHHHPANKQSVLSSLIHRAKTLCDQDSLTQELEFLTTVFKDKGQPNSSHGGICATSSQVGNEMIRVQVEGIREETEGEECEPMTSPVINEIHCFNTLGPMLQEKWMVPHRLCAEASFECWLLFKCPLCNDKNTSSPATTLPRTTLQ